VQRFARDRFGWNVAAALVFALAMVSLFHGYANGDLRDLVPAAIHRELESSAGTPLLAADQRVVVAVAGRNARVLLAQPSHLFEAESCYPVEKALALGEPEITLGIMGMPAAFVLRDPIASFNFALLAITLLAAFAMYALTCDLTGVPAAGIVAGLLYAFHPMKVEDPGHAFGYDTGWTVLALLFARRWFERGRWRDALALALCACLQVSSSLYPLLCAVVVAAPYAIWLVWRHGVRRLRPAQCAVVAGSVLAAAALVFTPYLELRGEGLIQARSFQAFMPWGWLAPGGRLFPGAVLAGLLCAGLLLRDPQRPGGDPRWALLVGCALALVLAAGGNQGDRMLAFTSGGSLPPELPNPYAWLAAVLPGLEVVRNPYALFLGAHVAASVLAGLGAAALLRRTPARVAPIAAMLLIAFAWVDALRPRTLGFEPRVEYRMLSMRPGADELAFFEELARQGNRGPLLEVPIHPKHAARISKAVLLSAYHLRRTSPCYNSFVPPVTGEVAKLASELPDGAALQALARLGFTTVIAHHPALSGPVAAELHRRLEAAAASGAGLRRVHADASRTAYEILSGPGGA
jgi:hypothetical protein